MKNWLWLAIPGCRLMMKDSRFETVRLIRSLFYVKACFVELQTKVWDNEHGAALYSNSEKKITPGIGPAGQAFGGRSS